VKSFEYVNLIIWERGYDTQMENFHFIFTFFCSTKKFISSHYINKILPFSAYFHHVLKKRIFFFALVVIFLFFDNKSQQCFDIFICNEITYREPYKIAICKKFFLSTYLPFCVYIITSSMRIKAHSYKNRNLTHIKKRVCESVTKEWWKIVRWWQ
jgi:hypothetical protein